MCGPVNQTLVRFLHTKAYVVCQGSGKQDRFLGGKLDDTYIVGLAIFRFRGQRLAMALGFSRNGQGRSGALDVTEDKLRFPSSRDLKVIGRELRRRVVLRLARKGVPAWVPPDRD